MKGHIKLMSIHFEESKINQNMKIKSPSGHKPRLANPQAVKKVTITSIKKRNCEK
jgi:hypothetical protein